MLAIRLATSTLSSNRPWMKPVPAGISLPMMTFSFRPNSASSVPAIAAPANTLMVCWKDEADRNESVVNEALVTPSRISAKRAGCLPCANSASLPWRIARRSTKSAGRYSVSPGRVTCTLPIILRMITSKCLSLMFWP